MTDPAMVGKPTFERNALDAYWTPEWCVDALLDQVKFAGVVWEPAAGIGNIVKAVSKRGMRVIASDIADHGFPCARQDFLTHGVVEHAEPFSVITNPPYVLAEEFVRHAIKLTERGRGKVAMLLRHEWDCAAGRMDLFDREPFAAKLVLTKRPRWAETHTASPRHNFAWFVWDWAHVGKALLMYGPAAENRRAA